MPRGRGDIGGLAANAEKNCRKFIHSGPLWRITSRDVGVDYLGCIPIKGLSECKGAARLHLRGLGLGGVVVDSQVGVIGRRGKVSPEGRGLLYVRIDKRRRREKPKVVADLAKGIQSGSGKRA